MHPKAPQGCVGKYSQNIPRNLLISNNIPAIFSEYWPTQPWRVFGYMQGISDPILGGGDNGLPKRIPGICRAFGGGYFTLGVP